ncbi:flagellar biosynthesis protein FlaG [Alteromonas aestuariivivens]|uniref:Flagellar biosynthesis protein FlaG n=1 Tax=Alteromonas aestuariivivens TaxID=1938339 RepID=A0A3D8M604_9ALTE|nr:flagellar protein FlaG [Alteromonas aestuariivivens]RDV25038.1 flagellar biosynthesis protein FlaG [Alteromonas aestuariivivens]
MEIANTQVGQNFALNTSETMSGQESARQQASLSKVERQEQSAVELKTAQGQQSEADNSKREGQDRDVELAAQEVEAFLQVQNRNLAFTVDDNTQRSVVTVKDSESGDVIRQIPSDEVLRLAERIKDLQEDIGSSVGVLLNKRV